MSKPSRRRSTAPGKAAGRAVAGSGATGRGSRVSSPASADRDKEEIRDRMVQLLPRLRRFARTLAHDQDQSEDLLQETCARALTKLDQWEPGTRLDSWMFRIAQNLWLDRARAEKVRGEAVDIATIGDLPSGDGRAVTEGRLTLQDVRRSMARLAPEQQVLIALVCVDGLSYQEAAEVLHLPPGTVMSRLARARLALFEAMHGVTPGDDTE
jgi:RNA polymerase sigma-70 factor (ECF subfamily)